MMTATTTGDAIAIAEMIGIGGMIDDEDRVVLEAR